MWGWRSSVLVIGSYGMGWVIGVLACIAGVYNSVCGNLFGGVGHIASGRSSAESGSQGLETEYKKQNLG